MNFDLIVVLVRPIYPKNIGACARATANMGGKQLILIEPQCELNEQAREGAAGAQEYLESLRTYPDWTTFNTFEKAGPRIALTRRGGEGRKINRLDLQMQTLKEETKRVSFNKIYFIFGPEDDGLSNYDLLQANYACCLETFGTFGSLNLAQAVLLTLFTAQKEIQSWSTIANLMQNNSQKNESNNIIGDFDYIPDELIKNWLTAIGFNINARKSSAYLTLKRLFSLKNPTRHEHQVLEAILHQTIRKLN